MVAENKKPNSIIAVPQPYALTAAAFDIKLSPIVLQNLRAEPNGATNSRIANGSDRCDNQKAEPDEQAPAATVERSFER